MYLFFNYILYNVIKIKGVKRNMDARLFIVIVPLLTAASWALYNIGRVALQQFMRMTTR